MANLFAREKQLNQLKAVLRRAMNGQLQIVLVTGETGVGKTVLVSAFFEQAKHDIPEVFVARSRCHTIAGGHQEPYFPFYQILGAISKGKKGGVAWDRLRQGIVELAPDWLQVIPGSGNLIAAAVRTTTWTAQTIDDYKPDSIDLKYRLVQYTSALRLASKMTPLLLWIDDFHWSDRATIDLVSFLADHARDTRIMLVITYRPTDIAYKIQNQPHPVRQLVDRLKRYEQGIELPVPAFTLTDLENFLLLSKHHFPKTFVNRIWRQSGGNPFFFRGYLTLLHAQRLLKREKGVYVLTQEDVDVEIPDSIQAVIQQRLSLIQQDLRKLLAYASVQGERFTSKVLTHLLKTLELEVLEKLNLLERVHKLIQELEDQHLVFKMGTEYLFVHVLIQQVLYNDLSVGQRCQLHLDIGQFFEDLYGETAEQHAADLAIHFEKGGNLARAVHYYLQAGENALAILALDDALTYTEAVMQLTEQMAEDKQRISWQVEALLQMAEAYYNKARYEAILEVCDQGETLCQQEKLVEQYAQLLYWRSITLSRMGGASPVEPAKQALEMLGNSPTNHRLQGNLYVRLGASYTRLPLQEAQQFIDMALDIAEKYDLPYIKLQALSPKFWIAMNYTYTFREALKFAKERLEIAQALNKINAQISCHREIAYAYRNLREGDPISHNRQAVELAKQNGLPRALHMSLYSLSFSLRNVQENWGESLQILREAVSIARQYNFPASRDVIASYFSTALGLGRWEEAQDALKHYHERIDPSYPRSLGFYYRMQGNFTYAQGLFLEAVDAHKKSLDILQKESISEGPYRNGQIYLGRSLVTQGDHQQGSQHLKEALNYWQKKKHSHRTALCLRGLAQADMAQGKYETAAARLREALALTQDKRTFHIVWPAYPLICIELGEALLELGSTDEALKHAISGYRKFKKWGHLLLGRAAFIVGKILVSQNDPTEAIGYLKEAHNNWQRLELVHHLLEWEDFVQQQKFFKDNLLFSP